MSEPVAQPTGTVLSKAVPPAPAPVEPSAPSVPAAASGAPSLYEGDESWKNSLGEELRNDPTIKNIKKLEDGFKMLVHSQKAIGADKIVVPGKNATDEDMLKVFDKLGRPDSPDKYEFKMKEGTKVNEEFHKSFKSTLHTAGILPAQATKLFDWYQGEVEKAQIAAVKQQEDDQNKSIEGLKKELGQAYETKITEAKQSLKSILGEEQANKIAEDPVLGNHPEFIKLAIRLAELTKEDKVDRKDSSLQGALTPKEASRKANEIMMDPKHPANIKGHPNHKMAVEELSKLFEMQVQ